MKRVLRTAFLVLVGLACAATVRAESARPEDPGTREESIIVSGEPSDQSGASVSMQEARIAAGGEDQEEEKKEKERVPKRTKDSKKDEGEEESDDGDFMTNCLESCLDDMFMSIFFSHHHEESEEGVEQEPEGIEPATGQVQGGGQALSEPGRLVAMGDTCVISPRVQETDAASVWSEAGCAGQTGRFICRLARGSRVRVTELTECEGVRWLEVVPLDGECPGGWMLEQDLVWPEGTQMIVGQHAEGKLVGYRQGIQLMLSASLAAFLSSVLSDEYPGGEVALGVKVPMSQVFTLGARVGVQVAEGEPQYDYETPTQKDVPRDSELMIVDIGAELGLRLHALYGTLCFTAGAGPSVYYVEETATIDFLRYADSYVGVYEAELSKWKMGGQANAGVEWNLGKQFSMGANIRYSFIPWKSYENASLTLDWLDRSYIDYLSFGLTFGWDF